MELRAGTEFAGYVIERQLGAGGMGVVYLARHPSLERLVALKILNDMLANDPVPAPRSNGRPSSRPGSNIRISLPCTTAAVPGIRRCGCPCAISPEAMLPVC